jgi:hypothetical protein
MTSKLIGRQSGILETAQPHVLDHALTQRTDWPMLDPHGSAPVRELEGVLHL